MAKLRILTTVAEARLIEQLETAAGLDRYRHAEVYGALREEDYHETRISLPEGLPDLIASVPEGASRASTDAENAVRMYQSLSALKPVNATDRRLWAAATHGQYWAYTRWRYPSIPEGPKAATYIRSHWFVTGTGLASLRRNAVARLWWAAHLTVAPWERDDQLTQFRRTDRFHYTRVLLSSQQVYQDVIERDFGSNLRLRICLLDALARNRERVLSPDTLVRTACSRLNLMLEYRHLATLPVDEMHRACSDVVGAAADELSKVGQVSPDVMDDAQGAIAAE